MEELLSRGSGTAKSRDDAQTRREVAAARLKASEEGLRRLRAGSRAEEKEAARAQRRHGRSTNRADRAADPGRGGPEPARRGRHREDRRAGRAAPGRFRRSCVVTDLAHAWLTVYLPESDLGRIRLGQEAEVVTDGGQPRKGTLTFVASKAEFTPRNVQTRDERVKLVYQVKVGLDNADGLFKPGMPAEARLHGRPVSTVAPGASAEEAVVQFDAMTRRYGDVVAAADVSFEVRRGEMFGLIGPDGAGKTTTLRVVLGLLAPSEGSVRTCGLDPRRESDGGLGADRLPLAALLPLRRPDGGRERGLLRGDPRGTGLEAAARRAARDAAHVALPGPPRRPPLGRHEAEAGPRLHPHPHSGAAHPRRAHHRRRSRFAPRLLAHPRPPAARGPDHPAHHPVPGRGRALPAGGPHGPRPDPHRERPRRPAGTRRERRCSS